MYSEKESVLQLVALLKAHGISHIVLSPGSRNSPLIHSFASDPDFTCFSIVDERSAGFFTLGIIQATGKPVAVCCTSGTAALNLGPAVAEAYYQQLPLLAITADRPLDWIGQMDGQTVPQSYMFKDITRYSAQLPLVNTKEEAWYCNRLINEAILALDNRIKGPTHINIPLSEPLFSFQTEQLPKVRVIRQSSARYEIDDADRYAIRFNAYSKRMIVVGQLPPCKKIAEQLKCLSEEYGVVVLSEHLSNIPANETGLFDVLLYKASDAVLKELAPELVITFGGHIVSKRLKKFLRATDIKEHWHISPSGEVVDTLQQVTDIVRCNEATFLDYLIQSGKKEKRRYGDVWKNASASISEPAAEFSDISSTGLLMHNLKGEVSLQLANSSSVRLAQLFKLNPDVTVFCNRGTSGIDGSLSTAAGYAAASEKLTFLLIGDLSFFYDMNGLWNKHIGNNLRIFLNNNSGGEIFHTLPGLNQSEVLKDYVSATHQTEAKAWAEQQGFHYLSAHNEDELEAKISEFVKAKTEKPLLFEVFTSMEQNAEQLRLYYHSQKTINNGQ